MMDVSDDQLALEIAERWEGRVRYMVYGGWRVRVSNEKGESMWHEDKYNQHESSAREFLRSKSLELVALAEHEQNTRIRDKLLTQAVRLRSASKLKAVLSLVKTDPRMCESRQPF